MLRRCFLFVPVCCDDFHFFDRERDKPHCAIFVAVGLTLFIVSNHHWRSLDADFSVLCRINKSSWVFVEIFELNSIDVDFFFNFLRFLTYYWRVNQIIIIKIILGLRIPEKWSEALTMSENEEKNLITYEWRERLYRNSHVFFHITFSCYSRYESVL